MGSRRRILSEVQSIEIVRSSEDRDSLVEAVRAEQPDAIVTDIRMPPNGTDEGIQVARMLHCSDPQIGVLVLSQYADPLYITSLLEFGSAGRAYLLKDRLNNPSQLVAAIETVANGGSVIDPVVVDLLVRARRSAVHSPLGQLTAREHDVLAEIAQGKSNAAIAKTLSLTKRAVEKQVNSIFSKVDLGDAHDVSRRVKGADLPHPERQLARAGA